MVHNKRESDGADLKQPRRSLTILLLSLRPNNVSSMTVDISKSSLFITTHLKTQVMRVYGFRQPNITGSKRLLTEFLKANT